MSCFIWQYPEEFQFIFQIPLKRVCASIKLRQNSPWTKYFSPNAYNLSCKDHSGVFHENLPHLNGHFNSLTLLEKHLSSDSGPKWYLSLLESSHMFFYLQIISLCAPRGIAKRLFKTFSVYNTILHSSLDHQFSLRNINYYGTATSNSPSIQW